ncbi:MFS transporter [Rhizobium sp. P40RR-XXII]|uniref:MFS transporter n=1 Tax=unclassified Rhizobium TaxID=2613769 RepID=UPI001456ACD8|nr:MULTISPECIES: MFS transporter [unclassified Rhizobium]NLR85125.1 MFS transporter [Rhizobium sp. P28RR-XV]NLS16899.1 MFS transporter [Rhizobium sp. P40RR-XXII]
MLKPIIEKPDGTGSEPIKATASVRWALASLSLSMLMPSLDTSIANVGLPTLAETFGASFQQVQWVVLAYLLAITTLIVSVGRLGDIFGRRRLLLIGISLFTLASFFCGTAPTLSLLLIARGLQGLGAAMMMALTVAMVGETVPKERTGSAMGLLGTMSAIGTTLGPSLGGVLIASFGWESIFLVNVPLGIANVLLAARFLPADRPRGKAAQGRPDAIGTLLLALTLAAYALAMTTGYGRFGALNFGLLLAAAFGIALFVFTEAKVKSPLLRLSMFRETSLSAGLAMSTLVSTVIMTTLVVGPFYLSRALGFDALHVGAIMSAGPLVSALTGVPAGGIVDCFGAHRMTVTGLVGMIIGLSLVAALQGRFGAAGYIGPLVIVTANYALFQASNNTTIMKDISPDQRGVISGMLSLSRNLGLITGASVMGAIFTFASGTADIKAAHPEAVAAGMQITFIAAALLIAVTLGVALTSLAFARRANLLKDMP